MSISINSIVDFISSLAPLTFLIALGASIFGNVVAGYVFRKRIKEQSHEFDDLLLKMEEIHLKDGRIKLDEEEVERILLLLEYIEFSNEKSTLKRKKPSDYIIKIGEYLSNKAPVDALLNKVAK
ncbi:hypothetical protein [Andreprevotia chitinilytica]|uniref:hypothetical protein n=1 Tax=Andreprevotia chitinilytica TaxID=396808 RepID=UPI0005532FDD|nr:hypothetical protein [Andreprevotia chitinilytica]